ncbi:hypothetical protein PUG81_27550 [Erwiniaceae bacterium L1_54_6]|nr:hypothetical protein [Erwiniaceae bacterium L1_54_6]
MMTHVHCSEETAFWPSRPGSGTGRAAYLTARMPGTLASAFALHHAIQSGAGVRGAGTLCRHVLYHGITGRGKRALSENVMQALMTTQTGGRDAQ